MTATPPLRGLRAGEECLRKARLDGKCRDALRKKLAALPVDVRRRLDPALEQTGCLRYLA